MKKNWFYLFLLMALAVMPLTSCDNDDEPMAKEEQKHDPNSDSDIIEDSGYNALSWLQGCLVVVDENGEVVRRVYGKALDASQPDVISVPVADYAAAEALFLSWVAPTMEATKVDGGYDYNLTDAEGKALGSVSFRAVEDGGRVIARMSVADGTELKQISEVNFIDAKLWPENDSEKVEKGKVYYKKDWVFRVDRSRQVDYESIPFYCLQSNTDGKEGILIWLSPDVVDEKAEPTINVYIYYLFLQYLPTEFEAKKVVELCRSGYAAKWLGMLKTMKEEHGIDWYPYSGSIFDNTSGNHEFVLNAEGKIPLIGTKTTKIMDMDIIGYGINTVSTFSPYNYRYLHIKIIPPYVN